MSDLNFLSAVSMAEQVRKKKTSPVELVEAHLKQIERLNPSLNAFVHIDTDRPRRDARAAEAAVMSGKTLGPLHGVPVSIKTWPVCDARPEPVCAPVSSPAKMRRW
jgi:Asp-tRNA(Asn)/Glu-tRNA(Gln) amidotransferase A subunit family amidase